jgi:3-demethoxyubiquinol 3-hydroxylase
MLSEHNEGSHREREAAKARRQVSSQHLPTPGPRCAVGAALFSKDIYLDGCALSAIDSFLTAADGALRTLSGASHAARPYPSAPESGDPLDADERRLSGALMRVNHVGEVCAQALYSAQGLSTRDPRLQQQFDEAAKEETDHLAWTQRRLHELGARPSLLNPIWYAGAFGIGLLAGRAGDRVSLGFVVETERQVEQHLAEHLTRLPNNDTASRAVVQQMKTDEARHGAAAQDAGAVALPAPVRWVMRSVAKVMTFTAHRI